jgi:MFS family permease
MFNQNGLSLDQAPPISVVLRFFVTASIFGIVAGIMIVLFQTEIFDASTQEAKTLTHTLALGVMASFMLGALFQMLPVIAGVVLQTPSKKAMFVHTLFTFGTIMIITAFITSKSLFFTLAGIFLALSLLYATSLMGQNLLRLESHSSSSKGMLFALAGFLVAILLGLYLLFALANWHTGVGYLAVKETHYAFALFGWVTLLIVAISFQVIEMFFVTPSYPAWIQRYFIMIVALLLPFSSLFVVPIIIALLFIIYAGFTIHRLSKRKRPTSDATVWFWRFGMGMLIVSMLIMISGSESLKALNYITFVFFALSIVFAMVYKIVPFLVWFHLSNQGYMEAPLMFDIVHPKEIKVHFYLHIGTFMMFVLSLFVKSFIMIAGLLTIASFGLLLYRLIGAIKQYRYTQKHTQKMSW